MTTDYKGRDEKLQYDINRVAAKMTALSAGKTDNYKYLAGEEILPPHQQDNTRNLFNLFTSLKGIWKISKINYWRAAKKTNLDFTIFRSK